MTRERPAALLFLGLLDLALGGLCVFMGLATTGKQLIVLSLKPATVQRPNLVPASNQVQNPEQEQPELHVFLERRLPGHTAIALLASLGLALGGMLLIVTGYGLLHMRRWARWTALLYSVQVIGCQLSYATYQTAFVLPVIEAYYQLDGTRWYHTSHADSYKVGFGFFLFIQVGLLVTHALGQCVVLVLPSVRDALAGRPSATEAESALLATDRNGAAHHVTESPGVATPGL